MNVQEVLRSLVDQAGVKTVYGEPVSASGKTIVPVAGVRCGFGGGSGSKGGDQQQEGGGGGGGFVARPLGFIEMTDEAARFVPIVDTQSFAIAIGTGVCLGLLAGKLLGR